MVDFDSGSYRFTRRSDVFLRLVTRVVHEHMRTKQQSKPPLSSFQNVSGWCVA